MKCPKCQTRMAMTHSFGVNGQIHTKRFYCNSCMVTCTAVVILIHIDSVKGQGAYSVAKKMRKDIRKVKSLQDQLTAV